MLSRRRFGSWGDTLFQARERRESLLLCAKLVSGVNFHGIGIFWARPEFVILVGERPVAVNADIFCFSFCWEEAEPA